MTETYRSPPKRDSTELQDSVTIALVTAMMNPAVPSEMMFRATVVKSLGRCTVRRSSHRRRRYQSTSTADRNWEMTVAMAAPLVPSPSPKMNTGSSTTFRMAPMETVSMPKPVYPCALMNGFMPVTTIEKKVPSR